MNDPDTISTAANIAAVVIIWGALCALVVIFNHRLRKITPPTPSPPRSTVTDSAHEVTAPVDIDPAAEWLTEFDATVEAAFTAAGRKRTRNGGAG